jgi:asparagine synthase (glutamine-hydrolysing)
LKADASGISVRRYWQLQPEPELKLGSDEEYAEAFLDVVSEAIRCRLRSAGPVGCMLSGGVDSGSIAAIAASLFRDAGAEPLRTFSGIGPSNKASVETRSIRTSMNGIQGILPSTISYSDLEEHLAGLVRQSIESAEPFDAEMTIIRAVYMLARQAGVKVVLDGASADLVLASMTLVNGLLRQGKLRRAIREARGEEAFYGRHWPAWRTLVTGAWHAFAPRPVRDAKRLLAGRLGDRSLLRNGLVRPEFWDRIGYLKRRRQWRTWSTTARVLEPRERVAWIADGGLFAARERYDRVAAGHGVEPRDPFIDLRVIRFCLSLPWSQLQRDGYPKFILRNAMRGRLPDYVLWRPGKEHHGLDFTWAMFSNSPDMYSSVERQQETIRKYVDLDRANRGRADPMDSERFADWRTTVYLANWLEFIAGPICR